MKCRMSTGFSTPWPVQAQSWQPGYAYPDVHPPLTRQLLQLLQVLIIVRASPDKVHQVHTPLKSQEVGCLQEWLPDLPELLLAAGIVFVTLTRAEAPGHNAQQDFCSAQNFR